MDNTNTKNGAGPSGTGAQAPPGPLSSAPEAATPSAKAKRKKLPPNLTGDPRKIILTGAIVIFLFFGCLLGWAALAKISGAVIAPGVVKVEAERKTVQHLEGGIVEEILIKEGDSVEAGQPLIRLESSQIDASVDLLLRQRDNDLAVQARLQAEKQFAPAIRWPQSLLDKKDNPMVRDILVSEEKLFHARQESLIGQISLYQSQSNQIKQQIAGVEEQVHSEGSILRSLEEERKAKQELYDGRYLEKSQLLQLEREQATHQGQRGRLVQAAAEAKQKIGELSLRISDLRNRWIEDATTALSKVETELSQINDKLRPLEDAQKRLVITASVSGRVVDLKVHSKGGVIRPGEPLLYIVPENKPLLIEAHAPVNKVADIYVGQKATVNLEAFDRRTTPPVPGTVVYVSADRLEVQTNQGGMPYYDVYLQVDEKAVKDANAYLSPGMPVTVFLTTKERSVLDVILEPLEKNFEHAMRN